MPRHTLRIEHQISLQTLFKFLNALLMFCTDNKKWYEHFSIDILLRLLSNRIETNKSIWALNDVKLTRYWISAKKVNFQVSFWKTNFQNWTKKIILLKFKSPWTNSISVLIKILIKQLSYFNTKEYKIL